MLSATRWAPARIVPKRGARPCCRGCRRRTVCRGLVGAHGVDVRGGLVRYSGVAYDEELAGRMRKVFAAEPGLSERSMFGELAFLVHGNMAVSVSSQGGLLLRIDPADAESLVSHEHVHRFKMRGKEMDGWLHVDAAALGTGGLAPPAVSVIGQLVWHW